MDKITQKDVEIIIGLQQELKETIGKGKGPFLAAVYDKNHNLIAKDRNTVVHENCSINHAEINAIKKAEDILGTYNLAPYDLSIYVTSEPCLMCLGAIMWSGIKRLYYSVSSSDVEKITGFDEGYKPDWIEQFNKRGIKVYPLIMPEIGAEVLEKYVKEGGIIYKPQ